MSGNPFPPSRPRRILVCGGRDYQDRAAVYAALDNITRIVPVALIIEGGARGADRLAREWANDRGIAVAEFSADWRLHGRGAGHLRNRRMAIEGRPDFVVAFPGGSGTANMKATARGLGIHVYEFESESSANNASCQQGAPCGDPESCPNPIGCGFKL